LCDRNLRWLRNGPGLLLNMRYESRLPAWTPLGPKTAQRRRATSDSPEVPFEEPIGLLAIILRVYGLPADAVCGPPGERAWRAPTCRAEQRSAGRRCCRAGLEPGTCRPSGRRNPWGHPLCAPGSRPCRRSGQARGPPPRTGSRGHCLPDRGFLRNRASLALRHRAAGFFILLAFSADNDAGECRGTDEGGGAHFHPAR